MDIFQATEKMIDWIGTKVRNQPFERRYSSVKMYDLIVKCFPSDTPDMATR